MSVHRVRRLRWLVRMPSRDEAFAVRGGLRDIVSDTIVPVIGGAFDAAGIGDRVVHIRRLELHLRAPRSGLVDESSLDAIRAQVREQVVAVASGGFPLSPHAFDGAVDSPGGHRLSMLLQYLQSGRLPWDAAGLAPDRVSGMLTETAQNELRTVAAATPRDAGAAAMFLYRLLVLLPPGAWPGLARQLQSNVSPARSSDAGSAIEQLSAAGDRSTSDSARVRVASALLTILVRLPLSRADAERILTILNLRWRDIPAHPGLSRLQEPFGGDRPEDAAVRDGTPGPAGESRPARETRPDPPAEVRRTDEGQEGPTRDEGFGLAVCSAGLVLIAPFLSRLLDACGIVAVEQRRIAASDLPRACALLHYAATGRRNGHEFELGFSKVLLGLSPDAPVPFGGGLLEPGDAGEVDALLTAVVGHWSVLKHTSIDGLRTAFLQRSGLVTDERDAWRLQLEPSGIDVLLDHVPWSVSVIVLPWCTKPIQTEWTTR